MQKNGHKSLSSNFYKVLNGGFPLRVKAFLLKSTPIKIHGVVIV